MELKHRIKGFRIAEVWFADKPYDIKGVSRASFYWCGGAGQEQGFNQSISYYVMINLSRSLKEIYADFNRTTRNEVNQGRRQGFTITTTVLNRELIDFHNDFIKRKNLNFPNVSMLEDKNHAVFNIYKGDERLVSQLYLIEKDMLWLLLVATKESMDKDTSVAARYLTYNTIEWAKQKGFKTFSLSSIGDDLNNLSGAGKFKSGFSKDIQQKAVYTKIYNPLLKLLYRGR